MLPTAGILYSSSDNFSVYFYDRDTLELKSLILSQNIDRNNSGIDLLSFSPLGDIIVLVKGPLLFVVEHNVDNWRDERVCHY